MNFRKPSPIMCATPSTPPDKELRFDFETPQALHSLFGNDVNLLRYAEDELGLKLITRDGWLKARGPKGALERLKSALEDLEQSVIQGAVIGEREFKMAVDVASLGSSERVSDMTKYSLLAKTGRRSVRPKSPQQLNYLKLMEENEVVFGLGPAGTGKTYLAMAMGLALLQAKQVSRIVLTRPAVEAGEALGFLPGDLQEKVAPYLRPLYDAMHDMLPAQEGAKLLEDGIVEIAPLAYMRGRTLANSFVILDEAQNTTCEQMFMFLTRIGEGSRCVVTGDGSQVDLRRGQVSGLHEAERALEGVAGVAFNRFTGSDVVRHPVVARIIEAYDSHRAQSQ